MKGNQASKFKCFKYVTQLFLLCCAPGRNRVNKANRHASGMEIVSVDALYI
jgi:hypothetical protein